MRTALLLLADSRLPAGAHAHSGGLEPAVQAGSVRDVADLAGFLRARGRAAGLVSGALAAASCGHAAAVAAGAAARWRELDREAEVRMPSAAQRQAARAQGRALLRAGRAAWRHPVLDGLAEALPAGPAHPVSLGACVFAAGGDPHDAALITATAAITGPASAAVRLLGLDPLAVHKLLADLAADTDAIAAEAAQASGAGGLGGSAPQVSRAPDWAGLPAMSAPGLDMLAERHLRTDGRLFES